MATLKRNEITRLQAERRTAQHRRDFATLKKGWMQLGKAVEKSVQMGVPAALGLSMRTWLEQTFEESSAHIFRQLQSYRALRDVPEKKLEAIPEGSAHELTRLPEKDRKNPQLIEQAVRMKPAEFKQVVEDIREKKYGIVKQEWATYARRVPSDVFVQVIAAEERVARVLQVDISEGSDKRVSNLILVLEAIACLVNTTDESWLKIDLEGDENGLPRSSQRSNGTEIWKADG